MHSALFRTVGTLVLGVALGAGGYALLDAAFLPDAREAGAVGAFSKLRGTSEPGSTDAVLRYRSDAFDFSLEYPKELEVAEYDEGGGSATILFQKPGAQVGFQIFVTPYDGTEITEERLRKDIPSGVVENMQEVIIGKDAVRALIFESEAPLIGASREVWFIHRGHLYEVTTYRAQDAWLANILTTLDVE